MLKHGWTPISNLGNHLAYLHNNMDTNMAVIMTTVHEGHSRSVKLGKWPCENNPRQKKFNNLDALEETVMVQVKTNWKFKAYVSMITSTIWFLLFLSTFFFSSNYQRNCKIYREFICLKTVSIVFQVPNVTQAYLSFQ